MPFELLRLFRRRMLPLVVGASLVVAAAAPAASHVQRRRALLRSARADAERVALILRGEIEEHPRLWRYNGVKLAERLAEEGLLRLAGLALRDGRGAEIEVALPPRQGDRRLLWGRADVVLDGALQASVWAAQDARPLWRETAWLGAVFLVLAALLGAVLYLFPVRVVASAERRIRGLMGRLLLTLQEEDRRRVARELHDGVGQALTAARLQLLALQRGGPAEEARVRPVLMHLDEAIEEVRRASRLLSVPALGELGLPGALRRHCETFAAASGLEVGCDVQPDLRLPAELETACYRIVQECLTNTARHAGARRADVRLVHAGGVLELEVCDDGVGWDAAPSGGRGLPGIRERVDLLGGGVALRAGPRGGACVLVRLPVE